MLQKVNFRKLTSVGIASILMAGAFNISPSTSTSVGSGGDTTSSATGSISPGSFEQSTLPNVTISLDRVATLQVDDISETTITNVPEKLDILFLADNTGSMQTAISNVQENAQSLLANLSSEYSNMRVGVARYYGDPSEYGTAGESIQVDIPKTVGEYSYLETYKGVYTCSGGVTCYGWDVTYEALGETSTWVNYYTTDYGTAPYSYSGFGVIETEEVTKTPGTAAYELQQPLSGSIDQAISAINDWSAYAGGDWAEANFFALHQAATSGSATDDGYATGYQTTWRPNAKKVIVWFGDAQSHTDSVDQAEAIQALAAQDISVIAINSSSSDYSLTNGLDYDNQASSVASGTGGQFASVYSSEVASTMASLIETVAIETTTTTEGTIDLDFASEGNTEGLTIVYTCIDTLGCDDVKNNESRDFKMEVTGAPGTYQFNTVITDVEGAIASNLITIPSYAD